jgi:uncharacterized DUF497 family protein
MEWRCKQRFQLVGRIPLAGVIAVVYTIRLFQDEDEEIYRIISARLAEKHEQEDYYRRIQKI